MQSFLSASIKTCNNGRCHRQTDRQTDRTDRHQWCDNLSHAVI